MTRLYDYVGPNRLVDLASSAIDRLEPLTSAELAAWLRTHYATDDVTLTYVVTASGRLRLSDRHTEHIACAEGHPVRAAGEVCLGVDGDAVDVISVTNQSTGYCPEPICFEAVREALTAVGLTAPDGFSHQFVFRRCNGCGGITVVKDGDFECAACGEPLPKEWNFDESRA